MLRLLRVLGVLLLENRQFAKLTWRQEGGDLQMRQLPAWSDQQDKLISKLKCSDMSLAHLSQKVIVQCCEELAKQLPQ